MKRWRRRGVVVALHQHFLRIFRTLSAVFWACCCILMVKKKHPSMTWPSTEV